MNRNRHMSATFLWSLALAGLLPLPGAAQTNPPMKTRALRLALITAYEPCTAPNAINNGFMNACTPPTRIDSVCGFGPEGKGTFTIRRRRDAIPNMTASIRLTGLDAGCEGAQLCASTTTRATGAPYFGCSGALGCTLVDLTWDQNCCIVSEGTCVIRDSNVHTSASEAVEAAVLGCGIRRKTGPPLPAGLTFDCGYFADLPD